MEIARDFGQCAIICRSSESQNTRTKQRNATRRRRQAISSGNSRREIDVCVYRSSGNAILAHCWCATGFGSVASRVSRSSACAPALQLNDKSHAAIVAAWCGAGARTLWEYVLGSGRGSVFLYAPLCHDPTNTQR